MGVFGTFYKDFSGLVNGDFDDFLVWQMLLKAILYLLVTVAPYLVAAFIVCFMSQKIQIKWKVTAKPLKPKFSKMNPLNGFKRLFSKESLFNLFLSIVKTIVFGYVAYSVIIDNAGIFISVYDLNIKDCLGILFSLETEIGFKVSAAYVILALADLIFQKWKHKKDLKMSKQEVKDEYKNQEGDPQIKGQQKQRMRQAAQRRMMQAVPEADVVITNPTHFAVALQYDRNSSNAPVVTAKGADYLAYKIRDLAKENDVEIVEDKPLARMLYANVEVGDEIPPELYQAVAEVLAYVYRLQNKVS